MTEIPGSQRLHQLALLALDHGIASAEDGPVLAFAVEEDAEGRRTLGRFPSETLEEGLIHARAHLRESEAHLIAVCFDGFVTLEEGRFDAVWVMAQERGMEHSQSFFQRYRPADHAEGFASLGNAGYGGPSDPLYKP
ncbi:hypothetical protein [Demequina sp. NBRC 110057]|uniref:hypothetical protein n=1 Tax=Demequina sp. NBRC 110057 TaxID=1570346 RepID=UPI0009FC97D3|nr:hypothetical protein [Demequina sp. NBRC 110057]